MTSGITWRRPPASLADEVEAYALRVERASVRAAERLSIIFQEAAQAGAPWQDQTGAARRGLFGAVEVAGDLITIYLSHGADEPRMKSIALELANAERYAVIWPTIRAHMDEIWGLIRAELGS